LGGLALTSARIILTALFSFSLFFSFAQRDSLLNVIKHPPSVSKKIFALASVSFDLSYSNPDSSLLLANEGLQLSKTIKNDTCFAQCYMALGWCYFCINKRDSAEYFLLEAAELFHQIKQVSGEAGSLLDLCYVYDANEDYVKLLRYLRKVRPLMEAEKDEKSLANIDLLMGRAYGKMGLYAEGKKYLRQGINTIKKINQTNYLPAAYLTYGYLLMQENNYDSTLYYYRLCYTISKRLDLSYEASGADNLGEIFLKKYQKGNCAGCIDSSFQYYQHALYLYTKMNSAADIQNEHINTGKILRAKGSYKLSEEHLTKAFHYFDSTGDIVLALEAANELSALYKDIRDFKNAYTYNIISQNYKDTIDNKKRADSIAKMFAQYETEKKDRTIQLLDAQAKIEEQEISRQNIIEFFSLLGIVMLGILLAVLVNRYRIKQKLKEVKMRNQLAGDLHDEVGSSLSSILLLSKMASGKIPQETVDKNMLETIAGNTKEVIDKMGDIVWMMNPKYDEGENLREKLEQYVLRIKEIALFKIHLDIAEEIDKIKFPMEIRKSIFLIFKEAINNALKYSEATEMNISLTMVDKNVQLVIDDNGRGFDKTAVTAGNGLEIMAQRAKDCKGNVYIQSEPHEGGTQVKVIIPIPHIR